MPGLLDFRVGVRETKRGGPKGDAFLDGYDDADSRRNGTEALLDQLGAMLSREPAAA